MATDGPGHGYEATKSAITETKKAIQQAAIVRD